MASDAPAGPPPMTAASNGLPTRPLTL
jgi:hypothetical protein